MKETANITPRWEQKLDSYHKALGRLAEIVIHRTTMMMEKQQRLLEQSLMIITRN